MLEWNGTCINIKNYRLTKIKEYNGYYILKDKKISYLCFKRRIKNLLISFCDELLFLCGMGKQGTHSYITGKYCYCLIRVSVINVNKIYMSDFSHKKKKTLHIQKRKLFVRYFIIYYLCSFSENTTKFEKMVVLKSKHNTIHIEPNLLKLKHVSVFKEDENGEITKTMCLNLNNRNIWFQDISISEIIFDIMNSIISDENKLIIEETRCYDMISYYIKCELEKIYKRIYIPSFLQDDTSSIEILIDDFVEKYNILINCEN